MPTTEAEAARRHSEWDRQLETLDKREVERAHIELRLLRDQTASVAADLFGLRQELGDLASRHEAANASIQELRTDVGGDKPEQGACPAEAVRHPDAAAGGTVSKALPPGSQQTSVRDHLERLERDVRALAEAQEAALRDSSLAERLRHLERRLGDASERSDRSLEAAHRRLDELGSGLAEHQAQLALRASAPELGALRDAVTSLRDSQEQVMAALQCDVIGLLGRLTECEKLGGPVAELRRTTGPLPERMDSLDSAVRDCVRKQSQEFQALRVALEEQSQTAEKGAAVVQTRLDELDERVAGCESYSLKLTDLQQAQSKLASDASSQHASTTQRVDHLESSFGDFGSRLDHHALQLQVVKEAGSEHEAALANSVRELHAVQSVSTEHAKELSDHKSFRAQHASVPERLGYVEGALADAAGRQAEAEEAARAQLEQAHGRLQACERQGAAHGERQKEHAALIADLQRTADAHHASLHSMQEHARGLDVERTRDLEALRANAAALASEVRTRHDRLSDVMTKASKAADERHDHLNDSMTQASKTADERHAAVGTRQQSLEDMLKAQAEQHDSAAQTTAQELHGLAHRVGCAEELGGQLHTMREHLAKEVDAQNARHSSNNERLQHLEQIMASHAERGTKELESAKAAHSKVTATHEGHLAALYQRVDAAEKKLDESDSNHLEHKKQFDNLHKRFDVVKNAFNSAQ